MFIIHNAIRKYVLQRPNIIIKPTMKCNLHCSYCCVELEIKKRPKFEEVGYKKWLEYVDGIPFRLGIINISGGEPFLYPEIVPLVHGLIDRGHLVRIPSNLLLTEGLEIGKTNRCMILATYHGVNRSRFMKNLKEYKKIMRVAVREFNTTYQSIPGSRLKRMEEEDSRNDRIITVSPDLKWFFSCHEMEIAGR